VAVAVAVAETWAIALAVKTTSAIEIVMIFFMILNLFNGYLLLFIPF
jgi:hypothetical protein